MLQVIMVVMVVLGLLALVMWYMMKGQEPVMSSKDSLYGVLDPLTLKPLAGALGEVSLIRLAVPTADYGQELVSFVTNSATRETLLKHGPIAFSAGLSELAYTEGGRYLVSVPSSVPEMERPLDELRQKLFAGDDVHERIKLIHDMTETDFVLLYEDDEEAFLAHFSRCGFAPLNEESVIELVDVWEVIEDKG